MGKGCLVEGKVVAVCRSLRPVDPKEDVGRGYLREGYGLEGDAHAGQSHRQISLLSLESVQQANRLHGIGAGPGDFAENLTVRGIDLLALPVGARLRAGKALLEVSQIGKPPGVTHTYNFRGISILPTRGIFCRVVEGGEVARGDPVRIENIALDKEKL